MTETLRGKVALVTGGSRGIGAAIARRLSHDGAAVAVTYVHSRDRAEALVEELRAAGGTAVAVAADSGDGSRLAAAVDETARRLGGLDILVNNAGGGTFKPLTELSTAEIDAMIDVNVRGALTGIRQALRYMPDGGRIITIGSINAERMPVPGGSVYTLVKAAQAGLSRGLARELGPRGITVNTVQPGPTDTEGNPADRPGAENTLSWMALDRFGRVEEIAGMVAYLSGPDAGLITAASLNIDGGYSA